MDILNKFKFLLFTFVLLFAFCSFAESNPDGVPDKELQRAFKESYAFEKKGLYNNAINALKDVYDESSYELNVRLGWLCYSNKQYDESIQYYLKASALVPTSFEARFGIANPYAAQEKWDKVAEQYVFILSIDPQNTVANYRLGLSYYYKLDYQNAYKYFGKVLILYPFDYDSELMFGWTNYWLGKTQEAQDIFKKVLLINPDDASALEGLSLLSKK
jgi:tetratricopeptide (TPR) repeat protein